MKFSEVISHLKKEPGGSFTAVSYDEDHFFLKIYQASNEVDDPEWITVWYEGGQLFSDCGEEECYASDELPEEVASLNFQSSEGLPQILGYTADYVAHFLFPELPDPEFLVLPQEKREFAAKVAGMLEKEPNNGFNTDSAKQDS